MYMAAGRLVEDEGHVLICGGFHCDVDAPSGGCAGVTDRCFTWRPEDNEWREAPPLNGTRQNFLLLSADNVVSFYCCT